jgi:hypothetical protein
VITQLHRASATLSAHSHRKIRQTLRVSIHARRATCVNDGRPLASEAPVRELLIGLGQSLSIWQTSLKE